ncbi:MAG: AAA family ATPase [Rhizobiales bacterium]|nr:AAA family ATPase [Hyphomicrobiales bacterium]
MTDFTDDDIRQLLEASVVMPDDMQSGGLRGQWVPETLADAYAHNEPTQFLIDGLLPVPSLSIVYGGPGSLKSMVLADMALCVAGGVPWLSSMDNGDIIPGVTFRTNQAPVLWVDFDNGNRRTRERIGALGRGHELPATVPMQYVSMPDPWLNASDRTVVRDLALFVTSNKFRLIIVDNLGLILGETEENGGDMAKVMGNLRWLAESTSCAVVIVHHQRKSNGAAASVGVRKGESLRGHSSIEASLDLALCVERNNREDAVIITATKVRDYQEFDTFGAIWTYQHVDGTKMLHTGRFWSRAVATSEESVNIAIMAHIKNEMRSVGNWMPAKDITDLVCERMAAKPGGKAPSIRKVKGLLREMAESGQIFKRGGTSNLEYSR